MPIGGSTKESTGQQESRPLAFPMVASAAQDAASARPAPSPLAIYAASFSEPTINSICGAVAGAAAGVVTCPLDVIKTKLQAQGGFRPKQKADPLVEQVIRYRGMIGTAKTIWIQDGLRGYYRGLGPMLFGYLPTWAVYMGVYGRSRDYFYTQLETKWAAQMAASVIAGAASTLATNPIWVIKTRLMSQVGDTASKDSRTPWHYKNTVDAFRKMYRAEGVRAFYSGLAPALLGLSHVAIQFPLYEYFKLSFTGLEMGEASTHQHHTFGILAATFLSKVCATTATYPHEVLRTRLQTQQRYPPREAARAHIGPLRSHGVSTPPNPTEDPLSPRYKGVVSTFRTILREEGWRAFYHGMGTNLIRAVPSAMTTMLTYESLKRAIQSFREETINDRASRG